MSVAEKFKIQVLLLLESKIPIKNNIFNTYVDDDLVMNSFYPL